MAGLIGQASESQSLPLLNFQADLNLASLIASHTLSTSASVNSGYIGRHNRLRQKEILFYPGEQIIPPHLPAL